MKYLKTALYIVVAALIAMACDVNSEKFPVDFKELQNPENTGGFLRIINVEGGAFNLLDIPSQSFDITLEADDAENGGQLESVDFYVAFTDNSANKVGDIEETTEPLLTVPASEFEMGENGLPRATISLSSSMIMDALGLEESQLGVNAQFNIRWALNLTNGKTFSANNAGTNITGGPFYNSPYVSNVSLGVAVPQDQFVGTYTMVQDQPTIAGPSAAFGNGCLFTLSCSTTVQLSVNANNTLNGRSFTTAYLAYLGVGPATFNFSLTRDPVSGENITDWPQQSSGAGCGGTIFLGESDNHGTWDEADDSELTLVFIEDPTLDCAAGSSEVSFTLTKQS